MLIECKIKRDGGSKVPIGNKEYHFIPLTDGAHVADVQDEDHEARFLSISEAYRAYKGSETPTQATVTTIAVTAAPKAVKPYWSDSHPDSFEIGERIYQWDEVLTLALEKTKLSVAAWNALDGAARAEFIDLTLDGLAEAADNGEGEVEETEQADAPAGDEAPKAKAKKKQAN